MDIGKHLFMVQIWDDIVTGLVSNPGTSEDYPINKLRVGNFRNSIISQTKMKTLRSKMLSFRDYFIGFSHKEVGTTQSSQDLL